MILNPRLLPLRNRVTNARQFPRLMHLQLAACSLQRMPSYFHKQTMRPKETK